MAAQFVRVRLVRISGVDLNTFEFDYDLTWAAFFLNADGTIYGRFGGRDAASADSRNTLAGLRYALTRALDAHRHHKPAPPRTGPPVNAEDFPAAKRLPRNECIHCHQVNEFRRQLRQQKGLWSRDEIWAYPLPENVGLTLDRNRGDRVAAVAPHSPAAKAGLCPGDILRTLNGQPSASFADAQYALNKAPKSGRIPVEWERRGRPSAAVLELAVGWRKTNITWRPSLLELLPSLSFEGDDLSVAEKQALGLAANRLAFKQDDPVHESLKKFGVRPGDIVIGLDGQAMTGTMREFLGYVRRNYLVGDHVKVNVIRGGERVDLPMLLK